MINLAIMISGRGSNMNAILSSFSRGEIKKINPSVVLSDKEDAPGLKIAKNHFKLPIEIVKNNGKKGWEYDKEIDFVLKKYKVLPTNGLICLAGYMRILSSEFVKKYKLRIMNIHPSLLPSFQGLRAQKQALEYGVKLSGCTVHFVDVGVDTGPIILQESVVVNTYDTEEDLSNRILKLEHKLYPIAVKLFSEGKIKVKDKKVIILSE